MRRTNVELDNISVAEGLGDAIEERRDTKIGKKAFGEDPHWWASFPPEQTHLVLAILHGKPLERRKVSVS